MSVAASWLALVFYLLFPQTAHTEDILSEIIGAVENVRKSELYLVEFLHDDVPYSKQIAAFNGFVIERQLRSFPNVFVAKKLRRKKRSLDSILYQLVQNKRIAWAERISELHREKRKAFMVPCTKPNFFNETRYSGKGVNIAVLDDGVDHGHIALHPSFRPNLSFDFTRQRADPTPEPGPGNSHGTHCSGLIFMNGNCGTGIASDAGMAAVKMLSNREVLDDIIEGEALGHKADQMDIYTASWGPKDDGKSAEKPKRLAETALRRGVKKGRQGKGSLFIWASGNGGLEDDDCAMDGYASHPLTLTFGVVGPDDRPPWYAESCPAILAAIRTGCESVTTTDIGGGCTTFSGSSAVAPIAAALLAKALEANPKLTQRDIQHIVVRSSESESLRKANPELWKKNGAGLFFSRHFGFGLLDEKKLIDLASSWESVPPQKTCSIDIIPETKVFSSAKEYELAFDFAACKGTSAEMRNLERIEMHTWLQHGRRGDLKIQLQSPSGTLVDLLQNRRGDDSSQGLDGWNFVATHFWGENPQGKWTLKISDKGNTRGGHLSALRFIAHGHYEKLKL